MPVIHHLEAGHWCGISPNITSSICWCFQNHSNRIVFVHNWDDFQHQPPWCCISAAIRVDYSTTWAIHSAVFASSYLDPQTSGISRWSWNGLEAGLAEYDVWWCVDCSQLMTMPEFSDGLKPPTKFVRHMEISYRHLLTPGTMLPQSCRFRRDVVRFRHLCGATSDQRHPQSQRRCLSTWWIWRIVVPNITPNMTKSWNRKSDNFLFKDGPPQKWELQYVGAFHPSTDGTMILAVVTRPSFCLAHVSRIMQLVSCSATRKSKTITLA